MPNPNADTNLLFGILALQMDFIDREQLVAAMHAWVLDKGQPLGAILLQQKALASAEHALLDALVQKHLERHGHDPQQSLAAVSSVKPVRDELQQIADTDLQSSLAHVSTRQAGDDVFGTRSVGTATAAGQRFRILRPHARGGLGQVSVARDEELGREVALKEIQDRHADNVESRLRFLLEAEITGGLEHPGIVPVYGLGKYDDGRPYYAMRFIQGDSLKEAIERFHNADAAPRNPGERALALRQLLGRFVDVCEAIEYAHSRAVLHRDLKPGNIMLGKYGETLVVDWGLAKPLDRPELAISTGERALRPASASGSAPTQMGSALGTPQYMSPEQAAGHLDRLGTASDVYSLGATLYCLLTGRAPFEGVDVGTVLQRVQRGEFPPPRQVKRQVPEALEAICLKAMALQPERRYASARALADDIEHWLADEPVSAWREPWLVTARRWLGRHRTLVTATAATIVAATVLLSAATVLLVAAYRQADEYARAEARERRRAEAAEKQALEALAQSHQRLVRLTTGQGLQLLDEGDLLGSLPWLAEALKLDEGHATREAIDRLRLASVLQQAPRIAAVWVHEGPVNAASFSADGRFVATASADGSARVWDTVSRGPVGSPLKHAGELHHVAFSPDGRYVVTASADHTARVWNAASGTPVTPPLRHEREVLYALFSADNNHVLTASADGTARIWDCTTGRQLGQPLTHDGPVVHASFSPNGQSIVTASLDKTAQVWDAATGAPLGSPLRHQSGVRHAAFSPDGRWIVTAGEDRLARVWDVESGRSIGAPLAHREEVNDAAFSHDGRRIITASNDYTARVWNAADGRPVTPPLQHNHWVHAAAFSPDGQRVVTASEDQTARLWDAETGRPLSPPLSHGNGVRCAQFSPDGRRVLTAGLDAAVRIWEPSPIQPLLLKHKGDVNQAAFSSDGRLLLTASDDGTAQVWDAATGQARGAPMRHYGTVIRASFSPDDRQVITASWDETARVWNAASGEPVTPPLMHAGRVVHAGFSPDGKRVVTASQDGTARVWDAVTGEPVTPPLGAIEADPDGDPIESAMNAELRYYVDIHADGDQLAQEAAVMPARPAMPGLRHAAFSPDGGKVVTAGEDRTARVFDATTGQPLLSPLEHSAIVYFATFSPDGSRLVTASGDQVRLWDASTGKPLLAPLVHGGAVYHAAFSPGGQSLATASSDRTARLWDLNTGEPLVPPLKHGGYVHRASFSPDGRRLLTAAADQARIWDVVTGDPLSVPLRHQEELTFAAWSPDGRRIVTAGRDDAARIWDMPPANDRPVAELQQLANLLAGRRIDAAGGFVPLDADAVRTLWQSSQQATHPTEFNRNP